MLSQRILTRLPTSRPSTFVLEEHDGETPLITDPRAAPRAQFRQAQLGNPLIATIPVVIFTGAPPDAVMHQVLRADAYLQKPVTFDQLMEAITRLFGVT